MTKSVRFFQSRKNKYTLQLKHTLSLLLVASIVLTALLVGIPLFSLYETDSIQSISQIHTVSLTQADYNFEVIRRELITISDMFQHDSRFTEACSAQNPSINTPTALTRLDREIRDTLSQQSVDFHVFLLCENGLVYSTDPNGAAQIAQYATQSWYLEAIERGEDIRWYTIPYMATDGTSQHYFSLLRLLYGADGSFLGTLIISIDESFLLQAYEDLRGDETNSTIYILERSGHIISHPDSALVGQTFEDATSLDMDIFTSPYATVEKDGQSYLISNCISKDDLWIVVEEIPLSTVLRPLYTTQKNVALMIGALCLVCIFFAILLAHRVSKPLHNVVQTMEQVRQENKAVPFPQNGFAESRWIAMACEEFVRDNIALLQKVEETAEAKRLVELQFLQMQINPHFMHNTLFVIKCMVDMGRSQEACKMLDALNSMLKNILPNPLKPISLEEEMIALQQYAYILQKRYADAIVFSFAKEPECGQFPIYRFILQPIIENAAFHGFSGGRTGSISITARPEGSCICLSVADNGCGMTEERIRTILENRLEDSHMALRNIIERLALLYGDVAQLTIESTLGQGTTVSIILPNTKEELS